jgi:hypothetical protein
MQTDIDTILALTDRVQDAIDAGEWQRASHLETERRDALERLAAAYAERRAELTTALEPLLARTYEMSGLVEHHKRRVLRDASLVRTGHAAAATYAAAGSLPGR